MSAIRIAGGRVHDPANDVDGEVRDVCLEDGKVVADVGPQARRIDARGMVVLPGGVDIHAHIAGPKVNAARRLSPEERREDPLDRTELLRSGTGGLVPSTFATGYRYSLLGYTTVVEAAFGTQDARNFVCVEVLIQDCSVFETNLFAERITHAHCDAPFHLYSCALRVRRPRPCS